MVLIFALLMTSLVQPSANAWELMSENKAGGLTAYATVFWVEGYGPVTSKQFFSGDFENDTYWSTLTLMCNKRKLSAFINISQSGSGHEDLSLDDPGYVSMVFNGTVSKRYRTWGSGVPATIAIQKDASLFVKMALSKQTLSTSVKPKFKPRIPLKFNISGLSKAKTRFKYAGCSF